VTLDARLATNRAASHSRLAVPPDATAAATLKASVTHHVVVVTIMVDSVPAPARAAVQGALSSCTIVLDDLGGSGATADRGQQQGVR